MSVYGKCGQLYEPLQLGECVSVRSLMSFPRLRQALIVMPAGFQNLTSSLILPAVRCVSINRRLKWAFSKISRAPTSFSVDELVAEGNFKYSTGFMGP